MTDDVTRCPGISYQEVLDTDTHVVPAVLRLRSPRYVGGDDISIDRYISREWHELEKRKLWDRVWQYVCREEEIPVVGDHHVYSIAGRSYLVVRSDDAIKAFPNACLHRGRTLKDFDGRCGELRCPYHGMAWKLDGSFQDNPGHWDFPRLDTERFRLPECKVGTWAGFVFINPDPDAEPLEAFLGEVIEQFADWDLADRYKELHVAKVVPCNWKVAQEAFMEAFHVNATHPQIMAYLGDANTQVDVWDNFSRTISPSGAPSSILRWTPTQDQMMRSMLDVREDQESPVPLTEEQSMRAVAASMSRARWQSAAGDRVDRMSDAEMVDAIDYTIFPNFHPWGAFNRIVYRFRPNGDDHRSAIMEVIFLAPFSGARPEPAPIRWLSEAENFTVVPELGTLAKVFEQDLSNMGRVQIGLESTRKAGVTLSDDMESRVRWLHHRLGEWLEKP